MGGPPHRSGLAPGRIFGSDRDRMRADLPRIGAARPPGYGRKPGRGSPREDECSPRSAEARGDGSTRSRLFKAVRARRPRPGAEGAAPCPGPGGSARAEAVNGRDRVDDIQRAGPGRWSGILPVPENSDTNLGAAIPAQAPAPCRSPFAARAGAGRKRTKAPPAWCRRRPSSDSDLTRPVSSPAVSAAASPRHAPLVRPAQPGSRCASRSRSRPRPGTHHTMGIHPSASAGTANGRRRPCRPAR